MPLDARVMDLARGKNFAALTTLMPNGHPQTQVMWVDVDDDGEHLVINTEPHRQKFKNMARDPRVTVTIIDAANPYSYAEVRGEVVDTIEGQEARDHIDALSMKYGGKPYDASAIETERIIVKIKPLKSTAR